MLVVLLIFLRKDLKKVFIENLVIGMANKIYFIVKKVIRDWILIIGIIVKEGN